MSYTVSFAGGLFNATADEKSTLPAGERGHPEVHEKAQTHGAALVQSLGDRSQFSRIGRLLWVRLQKASTANPHCLVYKDTYRYNERRIDAGICL